MSIPKYQIFRMAINREILHLCNKQQFFTFIVFHHSSFCKYFFNYTYLTWYIISIILKQEREFLEHNTILTNLCALSRIRFQKKKLAPPFSHHSISLIEVTDYNEQQILGKNETKIVDQESIKMTRKYTLYFSEVLRAK